MFNLFDAYKHFAMYGVRGQGREKHRHLQRVVVDENIYGIEIIVIDLVQCAVIGNFQEPRAKQKPELLSTI